MNKRGKGTVLLPVSDESIDKLQYWVFRIFKHRQLVWNKNIIKHITRHNVTPGEIEEVCFGNPLILKSKQSTRGLNTLYYDMS